jgi:hypothetical protein
MRRARPKHLAFAIDDADLRPLEAYVKPGINFHRALLCRKTRPRAFPLFEGSSNDVMYGIY